MRFAQNQASKLFQAARSQVTGGDFERGLRQNERVSVGVGVEGESQARGALRLVSSRTGDFTSISRKSARAHHCARIRCEEARH